MFYLPRAPHQNQHDGANVALMLIYGAPAGRWIPAARVVARAHFAYGM